MHAQQILNEFIKLMRCVIVCFFFLFISCSVACYMPFFINCLNWKLRSFWWAHKQHLWQPSVNLWNAIFSQFSGISLICGAWKMLDLISIWCGMSEDIFRVTIALLLLRLVFFFFLSSICDTKMGACKPKQTELQLDKYWLRLWD